MAFKGMDPDAGREVGTALTDAGSAISDETQGVTGVVSGVEWIGPDYDQFQDDWNQTSSNVINGLVELLNAKGKELNTQADQQDDTSNQG